MQSTFSKEILKKQLQECMKCCDSGFSVGLIDDNDFLNGQCVSPVQKTLYMKEASSRQF